MRELLSSRAGSQVAGSAAVFAVLVLGGLLYASGGPPTRDILVTQMLINAIMVIGLQIYIGNTGVLSFGHMGFAAVAGYTFALLATSVKSKERIVADAPLGLADVSLNPLVAAAAAVAVTAAMAVVVGLGLARSGARSGAVAATVITLALLFMVHEVGGAYADLTGGRNGIRFAVGRGLDGRGWVYLALLGALVVARFFKSSRIGRMAQAAREDDLAARAMGIDPARGQMPALLLSVAVVSVAASLRVFQLGTVAPSTFFFDYTLLTLVMLIVGGRNSIAGSVLGVALMTAVNEATRHLAAVEIDGGPMDFLDIVLRPGLTDIVLGGSMLGFMIFRARGLIEDWEFDHWLRRRLGRAESMPDPLRPAPVEGGFAGGATAGGARSEVRPAPVEGGFAGGATAGGARSEVRPAPVEGGFAAGAAAGGARSEVRPAPVEGGFAAGAAAGGARREVRPAPVGDGFATGVAASVAPEPAELRAAGVTVDFGGFRALSGAGLVASNHEIVGLIGPNGAGKTTLLNVITGLVNPAAGSVTLTEESPAGSETCPVAGAEPYECARAGLARTFQNLRLFPALTVRENVDIAALVAARYRPLGARPSVGQLLAHAGLWELRDRRARELDYGNARRLELVRAAALAPVFILLDEPTSGMSNVESVAMIDEVRAVAAAVGAGVVVIDHDLAFITGICNRIYCLDQGAVIAAGTPTEIQADPVVRAAYLGTAAPAGQA